MNVSDIPPRLDGALVISVAPAIAGQLGVDPETGQPDAIRCYAVAQCERDRPRAYLFAVDAAHEVVNDSLWDSPAEAELVAVDSGHVSGRFEPRPA